MWLSFHFGSGSDRISSNIEWEQNSGNELKSLIPATTPKNDYVLVINGTYMRW